MVNAAVPLGSSKGTRRRAADPLRVFIRTIRNGRRQVRIPVNAHGVFRLNLGTYEDDDTARYVLSLFRRIARTIDDPFRARAELGRRLGLPADRFLPPWVRKVCAACFEAGRKSPARHKCRCRKPGYIALIRVPKARCTLGPFGCPNQAFESAKGHLRLILADEARFYLPEVTLPVDAKMTREEREREQARLFMEAIREKLQ